MTRTFAACAIIASSLAVAHPQTPSLRQSAEQSSLGFDSQLRKLSDVMINTEGYSERVDVIKALFQTREDNLTVLNDLQNAQAPVGF